MVASEWCVSSTEWDALGTCAIADHRPSGDVSTRRAPRHVSAEGGDVISRLFGTRVINDGTGMIQLELPHLVSQEADVPLSVQVNWSLVLTKAVARLYVIADGNRNALLTSVSLIPDLVPPHVCMNVRLDGSTHVRAVVECGDGTLLQVRRWVRVLPHDLDALPSNGAHGAHPDRRTEQP
jgi:predicted secreted protein